MKVVKWPLIIASVLLTAGLAVIYLNTASELCCERVGLAEWTPSRSLDSANWPVSTYLRRSAASWGSAREVRKCLRLPPSCSGEMWAEVDAARFLENGQRLSVIPHFATGRAQGSVK